jgi:hypothetical protein
VAAWAKLASTGTSRVVVSEDGGRASAFTLQYVGGDNRWAFTVNGTDADNATRYRVEAASVPVPGQWTHLVGVYDATAAQLRLYVNGLLAGKATVPVPWNATGNLVVGRGKYNGAATDFFSGDVDEVRVWNRIVYCPEIASLARTPILAGDWEFDEAGGTTAADSSGVDPAHHGALAGAAYFTSIDPADGRPSDGAVPAGTAIHFDGSSAEVDTTGPAVHTNQSFTVAAWVRLTNTSDWSAVVSQDASSGSGFYLQYDQDTNRWSFMALDGDTDWSNGQKALSLGQPQVGKWTHLVGVYDGGAHQLKLYVDGKPQNSTAYTASFDSTGPLRIGRAKWNGVPYNYFSGDIDSVNVFAGVLSDDQIANLAQT